VQSSQFFLRRAVGQCGLFPEGFDQQSKLRGHTAQRGAHHHHIFYFSQGDDDIRPGGRVLDPPPLPIMRTS